jgi:hypothetical protein
MRLVLVLPGVVRRAIFPNYDLWVERLFIG